MNVIGINMVHGASAALFKENKLIAAISEERLTRSKNEHGFPKFSIKECLNIGKLKPEDIDLIVYPSTKDIMQNNPFIYLWFLSDSERESLLKNPLRMTKIIKLLTNNSKFLFEKILRSFLRNEGFSDDIKIAYVNHHEAHAAGAYYTSGFDKAVVITFDGIGDGLCGSVYKGNNGILKKVNEEEQSSSSPGLFYASITSLLGFRPNLHEGKVVGLAAMGDYFVLYDYMSSFIELEYSDDKIRLKNDKNKLKKIVEHHHPSLSRQLIKYLKWYITWLRNKNYNSFKKEIESTDFSYYIDKKLIKEYNIEDIASAAQKVLEDRLTTYVKFYLKKYDCNNLCLAGGVFANVKLNQKLFDLPCVDNIYIFPPMGDEGLSVGAPLAYMGKYRSYTPFKLKDVYLGPNFTNDKIKDILDKKNNKLIFYKKSDSSLAKIIAKNVNEGKVVGLFRGRMEFGPRALGNRSILADPRDKTINDVLNKRMKRSEFMPFAPSVLYEKFEDIFIVKSKGSQHTAQFMTITHDVKKEWYDKIPAVVHVDGTARPQLVTKEINPFFYQVISEFYKLTGIPMLINTSFNMHEEPIVNNPNDAIRAFEQNICDYLILGNYYVLKK